MESPRPATRRRFLTGSAAVDALQDRIADGDTPTARSQSDISAYFVRYVRQAMASDFELRLVAGRDAVGAEAALAAFDLIDRIEAQISIYRSDSELAELNRRAITESVVVEPRLFALLQQACELYRETNGAFDVTSGPLSQAWGFSRRHGRVPSDDELQAARAAVGGEHVVLDEQRCSVQFTRPDTSIQLNSMGKGYALDRAREVLLDFGVRDFLFHGGQSSLFASGSPTDVDSGGDAAEQAPKRVGRPGWVIGIGHPLRPGRRLAELDVIDSGVGTSGAAFQFFRHDGRRYGHILDPRTGRPAEGVFSTTVVAPTAAEADALSTAFYVLGADAAERYCANRADIRAVLLSPNSHGSGLEVTTFNLNDHEFRFLS